MQNGIFCITMDRREVGHLTLTILICQKPGDRILNQFEAFEPVGGVPVYARYWSWWRLIVTAICKRQCLNSNNNTYKIMCMTQLKILLPTTYVVREKIFLSRLCLSFCPRGGSLFHDALGMYPMMHWVRAPHSLLFSRVDQTERMPRNPSSFW